MILAAIEFPKDAASRRRSSRESSAISGSSTYPVLMVVYVIALGLLTGYRISREAHAENLARLSRQSTDSEA